MNQLVRSTYQYHIFNIDTTTYDYVVDYKFNETALDCYTEDGFSRYILNQALPYTGNPKEIIDKFFKLLMLQ